MCYLEDMVGLEWGGKGGVGYGDCVYLEEVKVGRVFG